jgi:putative selenate reductase
MCNECGNCRTFCPYDSAPYKDKFTLYWNRQDFEESKNPGFYLADKAADRSVATESARFLVRLNDEVNDISFDRYGDCSGNIPKEIADLIWTLHRDYSYVFVRS